MQMSGACASTTQAIGHGPGLDSHRPVPAGHGHRGRGGGHKSETQKPVDRLRAFWPWGPPPVKEVVSEAAKPFDADRNGTILGSGAVGMVVERKDTVQNAGD